MVGESLPGFEVLTWYGLFAPAHTPRDIVTRVHSETVEALESAEVRIRLAAQGFHADGNTPEHILGCDSSRLGALEGRHHSGQGHPGPVKSLDFGCNGEAIF